MKRIYFLAIFLIFKTIPSYSQDTVFVLHPVVGDMIDKSEKKDYLLFPEYKVAEFNYSLIKKVSGKYYVYTYLINDSILIKEIEYSDLEQYHDNIEKLHQYYVAKSKRDSMHAGESEPAQSSSMSSAPAITTPIITPKTKENIILESRNNQRLKEDAERMRISNQSGQGPQPVFEIFNSERKKKK